LFSKINIFRSVNIFVFFTGTTKKEKEKNAPKIKKLFLSPYTRRAWSLPGALFRDRAAADVASAKRHSGFMQYAPSGEL
jgi:hypothetical protein